MAGQPIDNSQTYDIVYKLERRIEYLEKDLIFIGKQIDTLELARDRNFKSLTTDLHDIHLEMVSLKNHFAECMHGMSRLGKELKNSVKNEDMQLLNKKIDEIKFDEYFTRTDLKKL